MSHPGNLAFTFTSEGAPEVFFQVISFRLEEGLSECFTLQIDLSCADASVDFAKVLDHAGLFTMWLADEPARYVHGIVTAFEQSAHEPHAARYRVVVEPELIRLAYRSHWRVFQGQSTPQIVAAVLKQDGCTHYEQSFAFHHEARDLCVQPGESDLAFIERISNGSGLHYAFVHAPEGHTLIQGDQLFLHGVVAGETVRFDAESARRAAPGLWSFRYVERIDHRPKFARGHAAQGGTSPSFHQRHDDGAASSQQRRGEQVQHADAPLPPIVVATMDGNDPRLQPGLAFDLVNHPRGDRNRGWRVLRMVHQGVCNDPPGDGRAADYRYLAQVIPDRAQWRPPSRNKPIIHGPQLATVMEVPHPSGQRSRPMRIKLQFSWGSESDGHGVCWVPLGQCWTGVMEPPRVNQQVLVAYLEGDCDRPVIIGNVPSASSDARANMAPDASPTTSGSLLHRAWGNGAVDGDASKPDAHVEDTALDEFQLQAALDMRIQAGRDTRHFTGRDRRNIVNGDDSNSIGNDATTHIARNQRTVIRQNQQLHVGHDANHHVDRHYRTTVGQDRSDNVGQNRRESVGGNLSISVGGNAWQVVQGRQRLDAIESMEYKTAHFRLDARTRIELRAPGGSIVIDEHGVSIDCARISIHAKVGTPSSANQHQPTQGEADDASPLAAPTKPGSRR